MHRKATRFFSRRSRRGFRVIAGMLAIVAAAGFSTAAFAGTFNYGSFSGSTVDFNNVEESSATDPNALYGAPTGLGDSLLFQSQTFVSEALGGASDTTEGTLTMTVAAQSGLTIKSISVSEVGNYLLNGSGGLDTSASVTPTLTITPFIGAAQFPDIVTVIPIAPTPPPYTLASGPSQGFFSGSAFIDLTAAPYFLVGVTSIDVSFVNLLETTSESNSSALIQKSFESFSSLAVETNGGGPGIPEPSSVVLLLTGLATALGFRRRR